MLAEAFQLMRDKIIKDVIYEFALKDWLHYSSRLVSK